MRTLDVLMCFDNYHDTLPKLLCKINKKLRLPKL